MREHRNVFAVWGSVAVALALVGCAPLDVPPVEDSNTPEFSGPYATELRSAWQESESDFFRAVIEDEVISDQELSEVGTRLDECLREAGLDFGGFSSDDGLSTGYSVSPSSMDDAEQNRVIDACDAQLGIMFLLPLHDNMSNNPSNTPLEQFMTDCLIRNGVVDAGYTEEEFLREYAALSFPFMGTPDEAILWACQGDPSYTSNE